MTFRKQAIATLKQLRADGYELTIKLNASNEMLHAELLRIERLIENQAELLTCELEDINEQRYENAQAAGLTDHLESEFKAQLITTEQLDQHIEASKAYDQRCETFKAALNEELNRNQSPAMMLKHTPSFMTKAQTLITSTDWQHVANVMAALIIPILYALLFTTILTGAFTFKALKATRAKAKYLAPVWNFIKFHPSIQGGYRSEFLELAFGLA